MPQSHVLSGLIAKRAELAGQVLELDRQVAQLRADLAHIDATIRIFDPEAAPEEIAPKRVQRQDGPFGPRELGVLVLDILRAAGEPLRCCEIARRAMVAKGMDPGDRRTFFLIEKCVDRHLRRRHLKGGVERVEGEGRSVGWKAG